MNTVGAGLLTAGLGYLLGSLNFAVIISKVLLKDDVRAYGSGNAGASNMMRRFGAGPAAATLAGDFAKGFLAAWLGRLLLSAPGAQGYGVYIGAYAAVAGHAFPLFFGFKGGKAIATALGALAAIDFWVFSIVALVFVPIVPLTGYVSLASVLGACGYPVVLALVRRAQGRADFTELMLAAALAAVVVFFHRANIGRLLKGTENKLIGKKRPPAGDADEKEER